MRKIEDQLAEYEATAREVYEMPPSDEKGEAIRIMSKILDQIIKVDKRLLKKKPVDEILDHIEQLYISLPTSSKWNQ